MIYLDYLQIHTKEDTSWFDDFVSIKKVKTSNEVKKLVMNFNKNKRKLVSSKSNKKIIFQNFISNKTGIGILNKYYSFYENLTKKVILNV